MNLKKILNFKYKLKFRTLFILLFLFNIYLSQSQENNIFHNPNGNRFSLGKDIKRTSSISYGDVNNNGYIDIIVANGRHWPDNNEIFLNNGKRAIQCVL